MMNEREREREREERERSKTLTLGFSTLKQNNGKLFSSLFFKHSSLCKQNRTLKVTNSNLPLRVLPGLRVHLRGPLRDRQERERDERCRQRDRDDPVRLAEQVGEADGLLGCLDGGLAGLR